MPSSTLPTRRGFIGAVGAAAGAHTIAGQLVMAGARAPRPPCTPEPPGIPTRAIAVTPDGRTIWSTDSKRSTITSHATRNPGRRRRSLDVGGAPIAIAISPRGDLALVATASYDRPGLAVVDLQTGVVDRLDVGPAPTAVAFAPDGATAYVAGGGPDGTLTRVDPKKGRVHRPIKVGTDPRGLAIHPDGSAALVALNGQSALALITLSKHPKVRRIATARFPSQLAISPDGSRAFVTHNGFEADFVTSIDLEHHRAGRKLKVGRDPAGVVFSRSGSTALVTAAGSGTVTLLDAASGRRRRVIKRGGALRAIAIAGRRAVVADALSGKLTVVKFGGVLQ